MQNRKKGDNYTKERLDKEKKKKRKGEENMQPVRIPVRTKSSLHNISLNC